MASSRKLLTGFQSFWKPPGRGRAGPRTHKKQTPNPQKPGPRTQKRQDPEPTKARTPNPEEPGPRTHKRQDPEPTKGRQKSKISRRQNGGDFNTKKCSFYKVRRQILTLGLFWPSKWSLSKHLEAFQELFKAFQSFWKSFRGRPRTQKRQDPEPTKGRTPNPQEVGPRTQTKQTPNPRKAGPRTHKRQTKIQNFKAPKRR